MLDDRLGVIVLVPIYPKRENFLDGDDKNAKLCVIMEIVFCIPSAYHIEAHGYERQAEVFYAPPNQKPRTPALQSLPGIMLSQPATLAKPNYLRCLEKKKTVFLSK